MKSFEDVDLLNQEKENVLGKEFIFIGNVRRNSYFNNYELVVDAVEEVNLDNVLAEFE